MLAAGLFLVGSFGKGTEDRFSDVDLLAVVRDDQKEELPSTWRSTLEGITPVVFWNQRQAGAILMNAIAAGQTRCDLVIPVGSMHQGRLKDTVRVLVDRDGLYETLPPHLISSGPNVDRVKYLVNEAIPVPGLMTVVVGRSEYFTEFAGAGLLHDHLASLLVEQAGHAYPGGHST